MSKRCSGCRGKGYLYKAEFVQCPNCKSTREPMIKGPMYKDIIWEGDEEVLGVAFVNLGRTKIKIQSGIISIPKQFVDKEIHLVITRVRDKIEI
jgi:hypothetical protein